MLMGMERLRLRRQHRALRQQWADVYDDFGGPERCMLPHHMSHRLATIAGQMRQIEADLGEEVSAG